MERVGGSDVAVVVPTLNEKEGIGSTLRLYVTV